MPSAQPFHHDSHAYGGRGQREDFTIGASFGASRALVFKHVASDARFDFPQNNGDVFGFTSPVNKAFQHGIPQEANVRVGPRFSVIAWSAPGGSRDALCGWRASFGPSPKATGGRGRRKVLTVRNGGLDEAGTRIPCADDDAAAAAAPSGYGAHGAADGDRPPEKTMDLAEVESLVERFVLAEKQRAGRMAAHKAGAPATVAAPAVGALSSATAAAAGGGTRRPGGSRVRAGWVVNFCGGI